MPCESIVGRCLLVLVLNLHSLEATLQPPNGTNNSMSTIITMRHRHRIVQRSSSLWENTKINRAGIPLENTSSSNSNETKTSRLIVALPENLKLQKSLRSFAIVPRSRRRPFILHEQPEQTFVQSQAPVEADTSLKTSQMIGFAFPLSVSTISNSGDSNAAIDNSKPAVTLAYADPLNSKLLNGSFASREPANTLDDNSGSRRVGSTSSLSWISESLQQLMGTGNAIEVGEYLLKPVIGQNSSSFRSLLSPNVLSPVLLDARRQPPSEVSGGSSSVEPNRLLSPSIVSVFNQSNALINLPNLLAAYPQLYNATADVLLELTKRLKETPVSPSAADLSVPENWLSMDNSIDDPVNDFPEKPNRPWLLIQRASITGDQVREIAVFHRNWASNRTLREEWRSWYRARGNYSDDLLLKLTTLHVNKPFDEILRDSIIGTPFILDSNEASSPIINVSLIESPFVLSPYIFGPFILAPVVKSPAVLSPSILTPAILSPFLLSPFVLSPQVLNPQILSPQVLSPPVLSPGVLNPSILSPTVLNPCILSPFALGPAVLSPGVLSPSVLCPSVLPVYEAATSAEEEKPILSPCILC